MAQWRKNSEKRPISFTHKRRTSPSVMNRKAAHLVLQPNPRQPPQLHASLPFRAPESQPRPLAQRHLPSILFRAVQAEVADPLNSNHGMQVSKPPAANDGNRNVLMPREPRKNLLH